MSTAPSSTDPTNGHPAGPSTGPSTGPARHSARPSARPSALHWARGLWQAVRGAFGDVVPLIRFRGAGLRGASRIAAGLGLTTIVLLTVLAGWLPAYLPGAAASERSEAIRMLLPAAYLGVLFLAIVSVVASGGGRELLPREQAVAFPVSPATDHLGALLMAPLNIAWLVQSWVTLGATAYVVGDGWHLAAAQTPVLVWLLAATALAQVAGWAAEWVRRGRYGSWLSKALAAMPLAGAAAVVTTGSFDGLVDGAPTQWVARGVELGAHGSWLGWLVVVCGLLVVTLLAVGLGAAGAQRVALRPARDELRLESSTRPPRANPGSDLAALLRIDRVGIWRSVPLRRGFLVLATLPGLGAVAAGLDWEASIILPGLVASAAALLFGVNSWCLDGRGALWRDSLPISPVVAFTSRVFVLLEPVVLAITLTVVLASLRAGAPTGSQLVAMLCAAVVGSLQVVAFSLRWSVRRPFAVDMRSARATPAPPLVMVGYSTRLALSTTLTGLLFTITARVPDWRWSLLLALVLVALSGFKLRRTSTEWADPQIRSRVISTVAS